jgi:thiamine biosynthesis lipoprotein ApbE
MNRTVFKTISRKGRVMGTEAHLMVTTNDAEAGEEDLRHAEEDLRETERVLSRFREDSELSQLNREGNLVAGERLLTAMQAAARAYTLSGGLLDPRVIGSLEKLGYRESLPRGEVEVAGKPKPLPRVDDIESWIEGGRGGSASP